MSSPHQLPNDASGSGDRLLLERLLVGVDGSDAAGAACSFGLRLAGRARGEVMLLHACEHPLAETGEWRRRLRNLAGYAAATATVTTRVVEGDPAAALLAAAAAVEADLILLGSKGAGPLRGVSSQVAEHAPCAVMIFRSGVHVAPARMASVVVGVDGSEHSLRALRLAEGLAGLLRVRLVLVSAFDVAPTLVAPSPDLRQELRLHGSDVLRAARERLDCEGEVVEELRDSRPRTALVDACERHGPAILVVGTRGLGGFTGLLVGSVSRWALSHATCPVVVAR